MIAGFSRPPPVLLECSRVAGRRFGLGLVLAGAVTAGVACLRDPGFPCEASDQCLVHEGGFCEESGWCSYPDDGCGSMRRYGPHAPDGIAGTCVEPDAADSGGSDDGTVTPPKSACGNAEVDPGETCDDGNRVGGDACPGHCAESGTILWTVTWDGEAHSEDKGFGVAVDPSLESFYVTGFVSTTPGDPDILVQRRWIENGELVWTRSHGDGAGGTDMGENVAVTPEGDVVVVGVEGETETIAHTAGDVWLRKYDADGEERWTTRYDHAGLRDHGHGVSVSPSGAIVAAGLVFSDPSSPDDDDAWIQRYDAEGTAVGEPIVRGRLGSRDEALDAISDGEGFIVTGLLTDDIPEHQVWTARFDPSAVLSWEDLAKQDPVGNEARGVGMAIDPMGGVTTVGVLSNDIWIQRYAADGTPGPTIRESGSADAHDEAADVVFTPDGRFLVVGFVDFATVGFATGDVWVRLHSPDGTPLWTDTYDGPAEEIDKALAVELAGDESAIVVGYETVPGQSRDLWIRRYAL